MENKKAEVKEKVLHSASGMATLVGNIIGELAAWFLIVWCIIMLSEGKGSVGLLAAIIAVLAIYSCVAAPVMFSGLRVVRPNEALVLTFFGKYYGTLKTDGFFFVNPFATAAPVPQSKGGDANQQPASPKPSSFSAISINDFSSVIKPRRLSLKAMTLNNDRQKINDKLGNPIIIGIVVIWRVVDTAKAMFNVENFAEFLSIQADSALRATVRLYPYDETDDDDKSEKSLRSSSDEVSGKIKELLQRNVEVAGLEVIDARITQLAYAPEIAAAMLQRQQASAMVDARQLIVEGAVGMVEMALTRLKEQGVVDLDEERKAVMVSNLMVVLCGNRDAQPVINSGSLY
ncbi:membrane protein [Clostridia bacterium]|nr:membrane protein [Clostridia bacterium]